MIHTGNTPDSCRLWITDTLVRQRAEAASITKHAREHSEKINTDACSEKSLYVGCTYQVRAGNIVGYEFDDQTAEKKT